MSAAPPIGHAAELTFPFAPPAPGAATEVADGVLWMRLPLPMKLDHVNIYALDDGDGWTLIDAGLDWSKGRQAFDALRTGPLAGRPVRRLCVTHHHPDHIGMAARLVEEGAELLTTRTAWLFARMLTLDHHDRPPPRALAFLRRAGWPEDRLAAHAEAEPFNFSRVVAPLPLGFRRLCEGDALEMGGRRWRVALGNGHAPDHATFWSEDGALALLGDQCLPRITPNIGVYATEPEADPLGDFLQSCARFASEAGEGVLALPGHERPFVGVPARCRALIGSHEAALDRLVARMASSGPLTAVDCFATLYGRKIGDGEFGLATAEAVAHVNRLAAAGRVRVEDREAGPRLFHAISAPG